MWRTFVPYFFRRKHQNMHITTSGLGRPSALAKKRYSASRLSNIQMKKARVYKANSLVPLQTCTVTRSAYDPCVIEGRQPMKLDQDDLKHLAALTNGRGGILLTSDHPWSQSEPDINDIAGKNCTSI